VNVAIAMVRKVTHASPHPDLYPPIPIPIIKPPTKDNSCFRRVQASCLATRFLEIPSIPQAQLIWFSDPASVIPKDLLGKASLDLLRSRADIVYAPCARLFHRRGFGTFVWRGSVAAVDPYCGCGKLLQRDWGGG
jgi:hypothetical protein